MGQEIEATGFTAEDFAAFQARLEAEQALLETGLQTGPSRAASRARWGANWRPG